MRRPYTRSLDPQDYEFLEHAPALRLFEADMIAPHCLFHEHKVWENASIMQQLDELCVPKDAAILDVGSGGMFFPPYLASVASYRNLTLTDSMDARSDLAEMIAEQQAAYDIFLPLYKVRAENMNFLRTESFDVVMCISTIEHVAADQHDNALREMCRLTKLGGYIFITSDYFRSGFEGSEQWAASPYRDGQLTPYTKELVLNLSRVIPVEFVGDCNCSLSDYHTDPNNEGGKHGPGCRTDLDYRGDFVNNYSFVNICLRKL